MMPITRLGRGNKLHEPVNHAGKGRSGVITVLSQLRMLSMKLKSEIHLSFHLLLTLIFAIRQLISNQYQTPVGFIRAQMCGQQGT
jgi:hypothetical protein